MAGGVPVLTNSTVGTSNFGFNASLLKGNTITQTIVGAIISAMVVASVVVTIVMVSVSAGVSSPKAKDDYVQVYKRYPINIYPLLNDNDEKALNLTLVNVTQPAFGTVVMKDSKHVTYSSKGSFAGNDTFQYYVTNGYMISSAKVFVEVLNRPPELIDITLTVSKNSIKNAIDIFAFTTENGGYISDPDNDELSVVSHTSSQVPEAVITFDSKYIYYTPKYGFNAQDHFNYTVSDGNALVSALITINVENDKPVANPDRYTVPKNAKTILRVMENDMDINGDNITLVSSVSGLGSIGTVLTSSDGMYLTYIPPPKVDVPSDAFEYTITDGPTTSSSFVSLKIVNTPPKSDDKTFDVPKNSKDNQLDITFTDDDMLDTVTVTLLTYPTRGTFQFLEQSTITQVNYPTQDFYPVTKNSYTMVYTPEDGVIYNESFKVKITDNIDTVTATITVRVIPVAPVATNDTTLCDKNTPITIDVVANDFSASNDYLKLDFVELTTENGGTIKKHDDKNVTYTPAKDFTGVDVAPYVVKNTNKDGTDIGIFPVTGYLIVGVKNNEPVAVDDVVQVSKGLVGSFSLIANDYDPNGDAIKYDLATVSTQGITVTISPSSSIVTYAALNQTYVDTFTYSIVDDEGAISNYAQVTVNVVNDAPVANDDSVTVSWNRSVTIEVLNNDADINPGDYDSLVIKSYTQPSDGSVTSFEGGKKILFKPNNGFTGVTTFTYKTTDGLDESNQGTVTVTVTNAAPVPTDDTATVHWNDASVTIAVLSNDVDADSDPLHIASFTQPTKGVVTRTQLVDGTDALVFTSKSSEKYSGQVSFTYTVSDYGKQSVGNVIVTLTDDAPVPVADSYTFHWASTNNALNVLANDADPNSDAIYVDSVAKDSEFEGTVNIDAQRKNIIFSPNARSVGSQQITYVATDDVMKSSAASVSLVVTNNNVPQNKVINKSVHWSTQTTGTVIDIWSTPKPLDADGDTLSILPTLSVSPSKGSVIVSNGDASTNPNVKYTQQNNYLGQDTFNITVTDGSSNAQVQVNLDVYDQAPTANSVSESKHFDVVASGYTRDAIALCGAADADNEDTVTVKSVSVNTGGTATHSGNMVTFVGEAGYTGPSVVTITFTDGLLTKSALWTVTILNNDPVVSVFPTNIHWTQTSTLIDVLSAVTDADNDAITFTLTSGATTYGTPSISANNKVNWTLPATPLLGDSSFTVIFTDGWVNKTATFSVSVKNTAPTTTNKNVEAHWSVWSTGIIIDVLAGCSDVNSDPISLASVSSATFGTASMSNGKAVYTPTKGFVGSSSFTYTVSDGISSSISTVYVTILDNVPVASNDTTSVHWKNTYIDIDVLSNDVDGDSDTLSVTSLTQPSKGSTAINGNVVRYTLGASPVKGVNQFTYKATDGALSSNTATVFVTVTNNNAPSISAQSQTVHWRTAASGVTYNVYNTPTDGDGDTLSLIVTGTGCLTVDSGLVKVIKFASSNFIGTGTCTATLSDALESSTKDMKTISYNNAPNAADISVQYYGANVQTGITIDAISSASDVDTDDVPNLIVTIVNPTTRYGASAVSIDATKKKIKYFPSPASVTSTGFDTFTYSVSDGLNTSALATVTVDIRSVVPTAEEKYFNVHWRKGLVSGQDFYAFDNITSYGSLELNKTLTVNPNKGGSVTVNNDLLNFNYKPAVGFTGEEKFVLGYNNGAGTSSITFYMSVYDNAPTAQATSTSVHWRQTATINLASLIADSDSEDSSYLTTYPGSVPVGTLTTASNVATFTPTSTIGTTLPTYIVSDGLKNGTATLTIQVTNTPPTVSAKTYDITWRNYRSFDLNVVTLSPADSDPNSDPISIKSVYNELTVGSVIKKDSSSVTVTAAGSTFVGQTSFRYILSDGASNGDVQNTITFRVSNTAPVANNDYLSVHWNTASIEIDVLANDNDAESDPLTISSVYGSLASQAPIIVNNKITYYPSKAPLGNDTLTYIISDGVTTSTGKVYILVTNAKPTTTSYTRTLLWKVAKPGVVFNVIADSHDNNADTLTISSFTSIPSAQGTLVKSNGDQSLLYTPTSGFVGKVDAVTFVISDGRETVSGTISIVVNNAVPTADTTAFNYHWRAVHDSTATINLNTRLSDTDADTVNITSITKNGNQGTVVLGTSNSVTYKLSSPWKGTDTFTVAFTDGWTASTATFSIVVTNTAPVAYNIPVTVHFSNYSLSIPIIGRTDLYKPTDANSPDSNNLYVNAFTTPPSGTLTLSGDKKTFTFVNPTGNLVQQNFTYSVSDGLDSSSTQTVTITLQNNIPTSKDQTFTYHWRDVQSGFNINLLANSSDIDGDNLSVSYYAQPSVGTLTALGNGVVKYVPPANQVVSTSFQFKITDGAQLATQTVSISVTNTAPVAIADSYTTHWKNKTLVLALLVNDIDANSDSIYISSVDSVSSTRSASLTLSADKKSVTYKDTSALGAGTDTFKYAISDSVATSSFVTVTITYTNTGPTAQSASSTVLWKNVASFTNMLSKCSDANNDPLSFNGVTQGSLGTVAVTDSSLGSLTYTPSTSITYTNTPSGSAHSVTDTFTYSCTDGSLSASGTVSVTITNTPPKGTSKSANVTRNYSNPTATFTDLLVGATDADGDSVTVASVALLPGQNAGTSVVLNADGSVKFTYANSFIGSQQFYVYLTDGQLTTSYIYTVDIVGSALNCIDYYITASKNDVSIQFEDNLRLALVKVSGSEPATISIVGTTYLKVGTISKTSSKWTYYPTSTRSCTGDNCYATYSYSNTAGQTVTCKVIVNQPNTAPVAPSYVNVYSVSRATNVAQTIDYLAVSNAYDSDTSDKLSLTSVTNLGTCTSTLISSISVVSNKVSFLRQTTFVGSSCWFIVGVVDSDIDNPIVVPANITITPTASPPIAVNDIVSAKYNSQVDIAVSTLLSNDYDSLGGTFKFGSISCPSGFCASGTPTILNPSDPANSQVIRVKPVANSCDSIQFIYSIISDQDGTSSSATATVQYTSCTCSLDMDIIFVLDGSGSITSANWINMKNFMGNVTKGFGSSISPTNTNIGIVQFASSIITHLVVSSGTSPEVVLTKISSLGQIGSGTNSISGVNAAIDQMVASGRKDIVNKMIIHVTDGESTEPCSCSGCTSTYSTNPVKYGDVATYCKSPRFPGMNCTMCSWGDSKSRCNPCSEATIRSSNMNSWYPGNPKNAETNKYGSGIWNWRQLAIGIGAGLTSAVGKVQIQRMNYDINNPIYVDWTNLSGVYQLVVDNSCNTVTSSQTKTLVPLANSGVTVTYKGKSTSVIRTILSTSWVRSTFNYTVTVASTAPSGVSKFSLAMASGYNQDAFYNYLPNFPVYLGVEPITNKDSFSFENAIGSYTVAKGKSYTYSLTIEGDVTEDTIDFAVFGDTQYAVGQVKGPSGVLAPYSPQPPYYIEATTRATACSATLGRCYIYTKFSTAYSKTVLSDICKYWKSNAKLVMVQSAAEKTFIQTILPTSESITFPLGMTYASGAGTWDDGTSTAAYSDYSSTSVAGPVVYANYIYTAPTNKWWTTAAATNTNTGLVCWAPFA